MGIIMSYYLPQCEQLSNNQKTNKKRGQVSELIDSNSVNLNQNDIDSIQ